VSHFQENGMIRITLLACILAGGAFGQTRPRDPFVFRTAINEGGSRPSSNKNRLLGVLLNANFTALYSTADGGSLFMARTGTAQDGNATYFHQGSGGQFGQCLVFNGGAILHRNTAAQSWDLLVNGTPAGSRTAVYKGFTLDGNTVTLRYEVAAGGTTVRIRETPEYQSGGNGRLVRSFAVTGLGAGQALRLRLSGGVVSETWTAQSGGAVSGSNPQYFTINANGNAVLTGAW
jgi:hypothetical protein